MKTSDDLKSNLRLAGTSRSNGFTLIEVVISMALTALMCGGLYGMGLTARRSAERNRLATEARSFAKERLEEIVATGKENLAKPSCTLLQESKLRSALAGYEITRSPRVIWHAADSSIVDAEDAAYVEAHVEVLYLSPHSGKTLTDTYSILIH